MGRNFPNRNKASNDDNDNDNDDDNDNVKGSNEILSYQDLLSWTENYSRSLDGSENSLSKSDFTEESLEEEIVKVVNINAVQPRNSYNFENNNIKIGDTIRYNIPLGKYCQRDYMNCQYQSLYKE